MVAAEGPCAQEQKPLVAHGGVTQETGVVVFRSTVGLREQGPPGVKLLNLMASVQ